MLKSSKENPEVYERIVSKFTENDYEKLDRLIVVRHLYVLRVSVVEDLMGKKNVVESEEEFYVNRLDAGLFTLQLVDFIIGFIYTFSKDEALKNQIKRMLDSKGMGLNSIKFVLAG